MIKQNIKVAFCSIAGLLLILLTLCFFIKIDISCDGILSSNDGFNQISIPAKSASYIESHDIQKIKIEYNHEYYDCYIEFIDSSEELYNYSFWTQTQSIVITSYTSSHVVINSVNVYKYILKK